MLPVLIKKELLSNLLNARIAVCYLIVFMVLVSSMVVKGVQYRKLEKFYYDNQTQFNTAYQEIINSKDNDWYWTYDVQAKPTPLSILAEGFTEDIIRPYHVEPNPEMPLGTYNFKSPIGMVHKVYDPILVIAFIISLLAFFISYDTITGEKELGTLRVMLAQPVSKASIILGKLLGGYLSVIIPVLFSLMCGLLIIVSLLGVTISGTEYIALLLLFLLVMLFLAVVFLLGTLFSLICKTSASAMFCSLTAWVIITFIIPFTGAHLATIFVKTDMLGQVIENKNDIVKRNRSEILYPAVIEGKKRGIPQDEWDAYIIPYYTKLHLKTNKDLANVRQDNIIRLNNQIRKGMAMGMISPMAACVFGATNLCGTGVFHLQNIGEWKDRMWVQNQQFQVAEWERRKKIQRNMSSAEQHRHKKFAYHSGLTPSKIYIPYPLKWNLRAALPDAVAMSLEIIGLFITCFVVFIKRKTV